MSEALALELSGCDKAYGDCVSNRGARLAVKRGSVHALVGENGAGKTTLLRIAYGEVRADAGRISVGGREVDRDEWNPGAAIAAGIGMVHQHFMLVPPLSVVENVVLGLEPRTRHGLIDVAKATEDLRALGARLGLTVWPAGRVEELSVGEQQRVEIVKVLWRGADVLLLDEPTAVLSPPETRQLLRTLERLRDEGKTVVLCTHRLDEVAAIADQVTVMRKGSVVAELDGKLATPASIARAMLGDSAPPARSYVAGRVGQEVLRFSEISVPRPGGADAVSQVSLGVAGGEIVGIAGVEGNGQAELVLAAAGLAAPRSGRVSLGGRDLHGLSVAGRFAAGLAHIPEDRLRRGVVADMSLFENFLLGRQREHGRLLDAGKLREMCRAACREYGVTPDDPDGRLGALSGGNQQKLVVARELGRPALQAILAAQPTRGVDVGAADFIRRRLVEARDRGVAILLVSSDLAELRELADRIAVMRAGRIVGVLANHEASDDALGALMTGAGA